MKVSYRTHPILQKLSDGKLGFTSLYKEDGYIKEDAQFMAHLRDNFKRLAPFFSKNVDFISKPFELAFVAPTVIEKMKDDELWNSIGECSGTILNFPVGFDLCYFIKPTGEVDDENGLNVYQEVFYLFHKGILLLYAINAPSDAPDRSFVWCSMSFAEKAKHVLNLEQTGRHVWEEMHVHCKSILFALLNFIKYAPIEIKHLNPFNRVKEITCKYINDTKIKMRVLDSKWFTTLVKSDAFKVRGHFRLQPKKKDGEWTKELIWINDFQKTGYTSPARKLQQ